MVTYGLTDRKQAPTSVRLQIGDFERSKMLILSAELIAWGMKEGGVSLGASEVGQGRVQQPKRPCPCSSEDFLEIGGPVFPADGWKPIRRRQGENCWSLKSTLAERGGRTTHRKVGHGSWKPFLQFLEADSIHEPFLWVLFISSIHRPGSIVKTSLWTLKVEILLRGSHYFNTYNGNTWSHFTNKHSENEPLYILRCPC